MKRRFKIVLDILMLIMTITLFNKQLISMRYHEIAGILLIVLVTVHIVVNMKIAVAMCKKFMKVPLNIKVGLIVDILLLLCFVCLGVSGILISKTILTEISSTNMFFKLLHMFAGGLSVILLGIHIGLHVCRKFLPIPFAVITSVIILCVGGYGLVNSSEIRWLSMPFSMTSQDSPRSQEGAFHGGKPQSENKDDSKDTNRKESENRSGNGNQEGKGNQRGNFDGQMKMRQQRGKASLSFFQKIQNITMFLGMILSFTVITYWIVFLKKKVCYERKNV